MRILQLDMGREWRGGQRQVLYLARYIHGTEGVATVVVSPAGSPLAQRAATEDIPCIGLPSRFEWDPRSILSLRSFILRERIDIVHTHCARSASLGAILKKLTGVILVHSRRVSYRLKGGFSRAKYIMADAVAAVSAEIGETIAMCGVPRNKIEIIHSGIDPELYAEAAAAEKPEPPVLTIIGAMTPQKGHVVFLQALAKLRDKGRTEWSALVVGDGALRPQLENAARSLGLDSKVVFTGYRDSADVLAGTTILAVPSVDGEGSSATIKEAWASNVPVIASDLASNLELVEPAVSGASFQSRNATALAQQLATLMESPSLRATLAAGGVQRLQSFTHEAMARKVVALYHRL